MKMQKIKLYITIIILLIAIFGTIYVGHAYNIGYSSGFDPVPTYVKCYDGFSNATLSAIHNSCVAWNGTHSSALVYRNTATHSNTMYPLKNNTNEITKGYRGSYNETYLMQTYYIQKSITTETIYEADIDINVSCDWGTATTSFNTQTAITHELGHLLGLEHTNISSAVMYAYLNPGETRTITDDDIAGIAAIY